MIHLEKFEMKKIGEWILSNHKSTKHLSELHGINFIVPANISTLRDVIYSFVIDSKIIYIGETTAGIASRFQGYRYGNPLVTDTDNRIKIAITDALINHKTVEIWYAKPLAKYFLANGDVIEIPASKPIEEYLISICNPEFNVKNVNRKS